MRTLAGDRREGPARVREPRHRGVHRAADLALLIFGDRLPNVIADGLRMLRNLRNMARNATSDLSRELGTDIQLEDLHPKAFIRKHLLSEEEEQALRRPSRAYDDVRLTWRGPAEVDDVVAAADVRKRRGSRSNGSRPRFAACRLPFRGRPRAPQPVAHGYDNDAT